MSRRKKYIFYEKSRNNKFLIVVSVIFLAVICIGYGACNHYNDAMTKAAEIINKVFGDNVIDEEVNEDYKDTDIMVNSNVTYGGSKYGIPADKVQEIVNGNVIDDNKYVFLTFD